MEFSVKYLHDMESEIKKSMSQLLKAGKAQELSKLNRTQLMKLNKDPLVDLVEDLSEKLAKSLELCRSAAVKIDKMKSLEIETSKKLVEVQERKLEELQKTVKNDVTATVKTELKTWADVAAKNSHQSVSKITVQKVVTSNIESLERSKNFIMYGLPDADDCNLHSRSEEALMKAIPDSGAFVHGACLVGMKKEGSCRPVKVTLSSSESVKQVLRNASRLRGVRAPYCNIYLAPDRTKEERTAHQKLVAEMKKLVIEQPTKHHIIRNGRVISIDKN